MARLLHISMAVRALRVALLSIELLSLWTLLTSSRTKDHNYYTVHIKALRTLE